MKTIKYLYVDTENVPAECWFPFCRYLTSQDKLLLPYTNKSGPVKLHLLVGDRFPTCKLKLFQVPNGTANALDFALVAMLVQQTMAAPKSRHILISKDNGYHPAMAYIKHTIGVDVIQVGSWADYKQDHLEEFVDEVWR